MPRRPRHRVDGAFYHVYSRGNRRQVVFVDDLDRRRFLRRLREVEEASGAVRVAHCLMPNHFHLLVRPGAGGISKLMHRVLVRYAVGFNRRHAAIGHLFQGRFGSRPLLSEDDLLVVLRYVHHNPLKAGLVRALGDWEWSSHAAHLQDPPPPELAVGVHLVRGLLCRSRADGGRAAAAYRKLMDEPAPREEEVFPKPGTKSAAPAPGGPPAGTPPSRPRSIAELTREIAKLHGVTSAELVGSSLERVLVRARGALIREAVLSAGHPARDLAGALGLSLQVVYRHLARRPVPAACRERDRPGAGVRSALEAVPGKR